MEQFEIKRKIKTMVPVVLIMSVLCSGCATLDAISNVTSSGSDKQSKFTEASRTVTIDNTEQYKSDMVNMIETGEVASECADGFEFSNSDITETVEVKQYYYFNNAIYLQVNDMYMYRFQLDDDDKVTSYIKYSILGQ